MKVLTDWFPATTLPVRKGEYLARDRDSNPQSFMLLWDGEMWRWPDGHPVSTGREWRGLAFDPGAMTACDASISNGRITVRVPGWWVPQP